MQQTQRRLGLYFTVSSALVLLFSQNTFSATADTFDINRYSTLGAGMFETFYVEQTQTLQRALEHELVSADTSLLVTNTAEGNLALIRDQMSFHHIAQGKANGLEWMATF